jgi:aminoglycoside phosphotransferase (APT) family kinase protein
MPGEASSSIPRAENMRQRWHDMPVPVRDAIETALGAAVVDAISQSGGFSPGIAARLVLADGSRAFVKAASTAPNPRTPDIHRREARIAAALPSYAPAPTLRWSYDDGEWVALVFDDIEGHAPCVPWRRDELDRALAAIESLADALTPSPIACEPAREQLCELFIGWQSFAADEAAAARLAPEWRERLADLVALEQEWPAAVEGDSLVHLDIRGDNMLFTEEAVFIIDWPWATIGPKWLDLAAFLPSVAMHGGPPPNAIWVTHPVARDAEPERVDAIVAALAGFFTWHSMLPPAPGIPTLRAFQAGQATPARAWLAQRRGWI